MNGDVLTLIGVVVTQAVVLIGLLLERGAKSKRTEKRVGTSESAMDTMLDIVADLRAQVVDLKRQLADRPPPSTGSGTP